MKVAQMTESQITRLVAFLENNTPLTENEILRVLAYAEMQEYDISDLKDIEFENNTITDGNREFLVLTDSEADEAWDESLDNYIEECIMPEIPEYLQNYFDCEAWKAAAQYNGRGHSLSSYDGCETEIRFFDEYFYIYRTN